LDSTKNVAARTAKKKRKTLVLERTKGRKDRAPLGGMRGNKARLAKTFDRMNKNGKKTRKKASTGAGRQSSRKGFRKEKKR